MPWDGVERRKPWDGVERRRYQVPTMSKQAEAMVESSLGVLYMRDPYSYRHSQDVGWIAAKLSLRLGFQEDEVKEFWLAGRAHDLGKITWPDVCFTNKKREEIACEQWHGHHICNICDLMDHHPTASKDFLIESLLGQDSGIEIENIKWLAWVWFHHWGFDERYKKNPPINSETGKVIQNLFKNFGEDKIQMGIGIMRVADSFHAAISWRPYRADPTPKTVEGALEEIDKGRNNIYHPKVVDNFLTMEDELKVAFVPKVLPKPKVNTLDDLFKSKRGDNI